MKKQKAESRSKDEKPKRGRPLEGGKPKQKLVVLLNADQMDAIRGTASEGLDTPSMSATVREMVRRFLEEDQLRHLKQINCGKGYIVYMRWARGLYLWQYYTENGLSHERPLFDTLEGIYGHAEKWRSESERSSLMEDLEREKAERKVKDSRLYRHEGLIEESA